ncbi:MAG TPA: FAD-dependent oxidoreductase [Opitutaceae bacterium]|jgi:2-polyprenyl-6-methoxyphenol hydroxylase-like FAD-dependent oxidoreductase
MPDAPTESLQTRCCIAGGGPAGMMLGFLLARAGVDVVVMEKHADFLRDFRGDTIHPSTLELMHELGFLKDFLERPHNEVSELSAQIGDVEVTIADFTHLPTRCNFLVFMPQWDFLDFIVERARALPRFHLRMETEVTGLIEEGGRVTGLRARGPGGRVEARADLVVGADGRGSIVRRKAGLSVENLGAPMDVLWMRLSKRADDPPQTLGRVERGGILIRLDRGDYWQCGYVIPKGGMDEIHRHGIEAFRQRLAGMVPLFSARVKELVAWDQIRLLTVTVDRLRRWHRPGLLCIGDAAHAMSPIGGVGINLAIQDAVAAANILGPPLLAGTADEDDLALVQRRRLGPARMTQRLQVFLQNKVVTRVLGPGGTIRVPLAFRLLRRCSLLRRLPARIVGMGFRPEHIEAPAAP